MIYVLAFFLPPVALLLDGHIFHTLVNAVLWVVLFAISLLVSVVTLGLSFGALLICSAHAIIVIAQARRAREHRELVAAARDGRIETR